MSNLKDIVVELHNCVHEFEPDDEIPMVWSREFQQKLAQNATHWDDDQRRASQTTAPDSTDMDFRDEEDVNDEFGDRASFSFGAEEEVDPEVALDATLDFDHEQQDFKTKWGEAFHRHTNGEEEVDDYEDTGSRLDRLADFLPPREEEEEEDDDSGLNFTQDPDKVARAKKLRDRAVKVRDKARSQRDKAKEQRDEEKGEGGDVEGEMGGDERDEVEDENLAGTIRTIPNAHLVFKRTQEDGTFDELWHYNVGQDFKSELKIRRAILAGTDIPINKMKSPDGSQTYELWTIGNGQMLKVQGLPN